MLTCTLRHRPVARVPLERVHRACRRLFPRRHADAAHARRQRRNRRQRLGGGDNRVSLETGLGVLPGTMRDGGFHDICCVYVINCICPTSILRVYGICRRVTVL
jgi:hypothetical protein